MIALRPGPRVIAGGGNFIIGRKLLMPMTFARRKVDVRGGTFARRNALLALDFFMRQKRRDAHVLLALDNRVFGAGHGNGPQQELGEVAEGGGFLARDAPLRKQAEDLGEGAVHAGGSGEVAAGGIKFGEVECGADDVAARRRIAKQLVFSFGVEATERGVNIGARHGALAAVRESELAAVGQLVRIYVDFFMRQKRRDGHALLALDNLIIFRSGARVDVGLVRREISAV